MSQVKNIQLTSKKNAKEGKAVWIGWSTCGYSADIRVFTDL